MNEHPWDDGSAGTEHSFCATCGEQLIDVTAQGTCPRCGAGVMNGATQGESLITDFENAASVVTGMRVAFWGTILQYVIVFLVSIVGAVVVILNSPAGQPSAQASNSFNAMPTAVGLFFWVIIFFGWLNLTSPPRDIDPVDDAPRARVGVRLSLVVVVLITGATAWFQYKAPPVTPVQTPPGQMPSFSQIMASIGSSNLIVLGVLNFLVTALALSMQAVYLKWLRERARPGVLDGYADTCMWLVPVLATVGILAVCLGPFAAQILLLVLLGTTIRIYKRVLPAQRSAYS